MLEIKNTFTARRNAFIGLINRQDVAKKRISEFEDMSMEISVTEMETEKTKQNIREQWDNKKGVRV